MFAQQSSQNVKRIFLGKYKKFLQHFFFPKKKFFQGTILRLELESIRILLKLLGLLKQFGSVIMFAKL